MANTKQIPCPFHMLTALRRLQAGDHVVMLGSGAFGAYLDGVPYIASLLPFMLDEGLVRLRETSLMQPIGYLTLSEKGARVAQTGEQWWASLSWKERLKARILGRA